MGDSGSPISMECLFEFERAWEKRRRARTCFVDLGFRQMCVTQIAIDGGIRIQWVGGNLSHFRGSDS